mmetsp:Transcript_22852/g.40675  ORF Transcript_22852/g.40675 Transcript_22852/m.40675 type:complete len:245 (-) Transcript_22852:696-1430(-)
MRCFTHTHFVRLHSKVLEDELLRGHACDGDAALYDRGDNLADCAVHGDGDDALQLQPLRHHSQTGIDHHIGMQVHLLVAPRRLRLHPGHRDGNAAVHRTHSLHLRRFDGGDHRLCFATRHPRRLHYRRHTLPRQHRLVHRKVRVGTPRLTLHPTQHLARIHLRDLQVQVLEQHLDLKLEVQLELVKCVDLGEKGEDAHEPGIGRLEDLGNSARLQHLVHKGDDCDHLPLGVPVHHDRLHIQVLL